MKLKHLLIGSIISMLGMAAMAQNIAVLPTDLNADGPGPRNTSTMKYDNGVINALPVTAGQVYGNRFDGGVGGASLGSLTLNSFSFFFLEDDTMDTDMFFQAASAVNTMSIMALASVNITGLMNSGPGFTSPVINIVNQTALGTAGTFVDTFYLGARNQNTNTNLPVNEEAIGLQVGFNAANYKGYTANTGTGNVAFAQGSFQAVLRANVTSAVQVPVELMSFEIEDE